MRKRIGVYAVCAEVFEHFTDNAFTGGDIAGEADDVFSGPATQRRNSFDTLTCFILTLRVLDVKGHIIDSAMRGTHGSRLQGKYRSVDRA
jgi:hypothetical protein